ncbi:hypothetical protein H0I23_14620 [Cellulophaga sp. HaHaR_3_176]|uniref:tetratricopeptide repeat protein n=1 Tax=Cellulophaga sp. HaHaR_3_176 TaxID=1942464 RepID=UPI001C1FF3C1|nr:hypothetical protein [Cellulophaga sp. HaHaR_3_176]QWX83669.1 hypothetical protein H0I23_14620 [Cellulophaga sp. HaHaR_3_176]
MKTNTLHNIFFWGFIIISSSAFTQEEKINIEESAEVFLEEYTDSFQENFFDALKQKGIENYDKAANLFLNCKQIDADNAVVDFELAKVYQLTKQFELAQQYAISAVNSDPSNFWYTRTLLEVLNLKHSGVNDITNQLPNSNLEFKQNLALIYYQMEYYDSANQIINTLKKSSFTEELNSKINIGLAQKEVKKETFTFKNTYTKVDNSNSEAASIEYYKVRISGLIRTNNYLILDTVSQEALDSYPAQPYFYYAKGLSLNKKKRFKEAISTLEESLDYMLDDIKLANNIYRELADAYNAIKNTAKANQYLRKVRPGF